MVKKAITGIACFIVIAGLFAMCTNNRNLEASEWTYGKSDTIKSSTQLKRAIAEKKAILEQLSEMDQDEYSKNYKKLHERYDAVNEAINNY
ncbi:MAG: hypothetical protein WDA65_07425 [Christensenellales bacterium]